MEICRKKTKPIGWGWFSQLFCEFSANLRPIHHQKSNAIIDFAKYVSEINCKTEKLPNSNQEFRYRGLEGQIF